MTNLYEEIRGNIEYHNKTLNDIKYISIENRAVDIDAFLETAKDIEYDAGYGGIEINGSLMIIGEDWWLERVEYDGSEWFTYKTYPVPNNAENEEDRESDKHTLIEMTMTY